MTASTASRPPVGMPPHLWELAKRDARGAVPERVRQAKDDSDTAPASIRAIARRAATASATFGVAAAAVALGAGTATAEPAVDLAGFDGAAPPAGHGLADLEGPDHGGGAGHGGAGGAGAGGAGGDHGGGWGGGASHETHGSMGDGPVSSGLGSSFQVHHGDAPGPEHTLTVSIFQDVGVIETADGNFQVDAYQYIVIRDSQGHEYTFVDHYQVTVPDPPGQETDLMIHETGHVQVIENADGSFTPVAVDHGITVTVGSDGDGRDEIGVRQDESVQVTEHGRPDPHDTTVILGERAATDSHDTGDEAYTEIDQRTSTGSGNQANQGGGQPGLPRGTPGSGGASGSGNGTGPTTTTTGTVPGAPDGPGTTGTGSTTGTGTTGTGTTGTPTTGTTTGTTPPATTAPAAGGTPGAAGAAGAAVIVPLDSSLASTSTPVTTVSFSGPSHGAGHDLDGPPPGTVSGIGGHDATPTGTGDVPVHDQVFAGHGPATGPAGPFQGGPASTPDAGGTHAPSTTAGTAAPSEPPGTTHGGAGSGNDHDGTGDAVHETNGFDGSGHETSSHEGSGHGDSGHEAAGSGHADTGGHDASGTDGSEHLGHVG